MRYGWARGLALSLGLLASAVQAQPTVWRSANSPPQTKSDPVVAIGKPIAAAQTNREPDVPVQPAATATLGKPVASSIVKASFSDVLPERRGAVVRGASPSETAVQRAMPLGPADIPMTRWRRAGDTLTSANGDAPPPLPTPFAGSSQAFAPPAPLSGNPGMLVGPGPVNNGPSLFAANPTCGNCQQAGGCATGNCSSGGGYVAGLADAAAGRGGCCCTDRFAVSLEYLLWRTRGDATPPLATASNAGTVPILGTEPSARVIFGGNDLGNNTTSGARLSMRYWFSEECLWGIDSSAFFLGEQDNKFSAFSTGFNQSLGRPIVDLADRIVQTPGGPVVNNPLFGRNNVELVAITGLMGSVDVVRKSSLWGYDINLRRNLCCDDGFRTDFVFGYRSAGLDESLSITENLTLVNALGGLPAGSMISVNDKFSTSNRFYGGQVGLDAEYGYGRWFLGLRSRVAIGATYQTVNINGTTRTPQGVAPGGLLALQGTNLGGYSRTVFGVIPEMGLNLGYQLTDYCRIFGGYSLLYWNNVQRPGAAIDPGVNRNFQSGAPASVANTGPVRPAFAFDGRDFWAHGLNLGLELRF